MITITDLRNFFGKRMTWLMMFLAVVMLVSMASFFGGTLFGSQEGVSTGVFAVVNGDKVTETEFLADLDERVKQLQQNQPNMSPDDEFGAHREAIFDLVVKTALLQEADKRGIRADENTVRELQRENLDEQLKTERDRLINEGKLNKDASDEQFKDVLRREGGTNIDQILKERASGLEELLKDERTKEDLIESARLLRLQEAVKAEVKLTEADFKKWQEKLLLRRVAVKKDLHQNAKERIEAAQAEIKKGVDFLQVLEKFSDEEEVGIEGHMTPKGQLGPLARSTLDRLPRLKDLAQNKPGYVSDIKDLGTEFAIYKIISAESGVPADFEQKKDQYMADFRKRREEDHYTEWVNNVVRNIKVDIKSEPWKLIYDYMLNEYFLRERDPAPTPEETVEYLYALAKKADKLASGRDRDWQEAALLKYHLATRLMTEPGLKDLKQREEILALQNSAMEQLLETREDAQLRLRLAQVYVNEGKYKEAVRELKRVSQNAYSYADPADQQRHWGIQRLLDVIVSKKFESEELTKLLEREAKWTEKAREVSIEQGPRAPGLPPGAIPSGAVPSGAVPPGALPPGAIPGGAPPLAGG